MNTISNPSSALIKGFGWREAPWLVVAAIALYFIASHVPQFFIWSESSYGAYFWPRATSALPHVMGGLVAIVVGPFQFLSRIRARYPAVHRITGRVYLAAIFVAALAGMNLAISSRGDLVYASGLFTLAIAWLLSSGMALLAILKRRVLQHQQWMIRSYVLTFAFITFRSSSKYCVTWASVARSNIMVHWPGLAG